MNMKHLSDDEINALYLEYRKYCKDNKLRCL